MERATNRVEMRARQKVACVVHLEVEVRVELMAEEMQLAVAAPTEVGKGTQTVVETARWRAEEMAAVSTEGRRHPRCRSNARNQSSCRCSATRMCQ